MTERDRAIVMALLNAIGAVVSEPVASLDTADPRSQALAGCQHPEEVTVSAAVFGSPDRKFCKVCMSLFDRADEPAA